eukprot:403363109
MAASIATARSITEADVDLVYEFEETITPAVISRGIDDFKQFMTIGFFLMFQLGYFMFEYGSVRKKNAETVLIKSFIIFITSCFTTFSFGYAFAYGESYFIGIKYYFTSFTVTDNTEERNEIKWVLLFVAASMTAQLAMSGIQERTKMIVPWFYSIIVTLAIFPVVMGWTLGNGFMYKLGLLDFSGCAAIHLTAGFCSFFACLTVKSRLGRYVPLAIKKAQGSKEIVLSHLQKETIQNSVDSLAKEIQFNKENGYEIYVEKARKLIKKADSDNFYSMNNEMLSFLGSIIMWFSLCHIFKVAFINCLVSGGFGGLAALLMKKVMDISYHSNQKKTKNKYVLKNSYDFSTQYSNPLAQYDNFVMGRGLIAGCVMVSAPGIYYKTWVCMILGAIGGAAYVGTCFVLMKFKIDDPLHVFQTHGVPAMLSLIFVVLFHQDTGIFFTDPNAIVTQEKLQEIIQIFGANMLAVIIVIFWCAAFTFPYFLIIKKCWLRVNKVSELIGLDIAQSTLGKNDLRNFIQFIITEYFPENAGEYLLKKKRLLEMAKKGKKQAKKQLTREELTKIKEMLDQEIREVFGTEAEFFGNDNQNMDGDNMESEKKHNQMKGMTFQEPNYNPLKYNSPNKQQTQQKGKYKQANRLDSSENEIEMKVNPKDSSYKQVSKNEEPLHSRGLGSAGGPGKKSEEKKRKHADLDDSDNVVFSFQENDLPQKQRNQSPNNGFKKQKSAVPDSISESDATHEGELSQDSASINTSNNDDSENGGANHSMSRHNVGLTGNDNFFTTNGSKANVKPLNNLRKSGAGGNSNRVGQVNNFGGGMGFGIGGGLNTGLSGNNQNDQSKQLISELSGMQESFQSRPATSAQHSKKPTQQSNLNTNNFGFGHSRTNTNTNSQRR